MPRVEQRPDGLSRLVADSPNGPRPLTGWQSLEKSRCQEEGLRRQLAYINLRRASAVRLEQQDDGLARVVADTQQGPKALTGWLLLEDCQRQVESLRRKLAHIDLMRISTVILEQQVDGLARLVSDSPPREPMPLTPWQPLEKVSWQLEDLRRQQVQSARRHLNGLLRQQRNIRNSTRATTPVQPPGAISPAPPV